jgi:dihydroorotate dehydrogenase
MRWRWALKTGMLPLPGPVTSPRLTTTLAGTDLPNPVGLAAGFDKNAEAVTHRCRAPDSAFSRSGAPRRARRPATKDRGCSA